MRQFMFAFLFAFTVLTSTAHAGWFDWTSQPSTSAPVYVRVDAANFRSAPSTSWYSIPFGTFQQNTPLSVIDAHNFGSDGTWYLVRSKDGRQGWVNAHLLSKNPAQKAPAAVKPAPTKEAANPHPVPPAPIPAKPDVKSALDTGKHCVSQFNSGNAKDKAVMAEMATLSKGDLNATGWSSPRGTGFSFSNSGGIVITINALPARAIQQLATGANAPPDLVKSLVDSKSIMFNAKICVNDGKLSIALTGTGTTDGKTGFLALTPGKNGGFQATGQIAGSKISESFTKASR